MESVCIHEVAQKFNISIDPTEIDRLDGTFESIVQLIARKRQTFDPGVCEPTFRYWGFASTEVFWILPFHSSFNVKRC